MLDKQTLGIIAALISFVGYSHYFYALLKKSIKPHVFSWVIWFLLDGIVFFAQYSKGAGPGSWVTGLTSILSLTVAILSLKRGEKNIVKKDWLAFLVGLMAIPLWYLTNDPMWSVILVVFIYLLAYYPTFRKSYLRPNEEAGFRYSLSALKSIISLFALNTYSVTTALYPIFLVLANGAFVIMLMWRRRTLAAEMA